MDKCCDKKPIYVDRATNKSYCSTHFVEHYISSVKHFVKKWNLIEKGDVVSVGVSGGKDSSTLLYVLNELKDEIGFDLFALLIDEGIKGYRELTIPGAAKLAKNLGVDLKIVKFKDYLGKSLDDMVLLAHKKAPELKPCAICGVFRRYFLNLFSRHFGATKIATGHNADDVIQTIMINLMRGDVERLLRIGPISGLIRHPSFVPRIKPLYKISEKENVIFSLVNNLPTDPEIECNYIQYSQRVSPRNFLYKYESKHHIRNLFIDAYLDLWKRIPKKNVEMTTCERCGEPSSSRVCRACQIIEKLGLKSPVEILSTHRQKSH